MLSISFNNKEWENEEAYFIRMIYDRELFARRCVKTTTAHVHLPHLPILFLNFLCIKTKRLFQYIGHLKN